MELLAAGERVFADRGYRAATVDDVIQASKTSRASFYRYFSSKSELFEELSRVCFLEMRQVIRDFGAASDASSPHGRIVESLKGYAVVNERYGGVIRAWSELTGPVDSPMRESGKAAVQAMYGEMRSVLETWGALPPAEADDDAADAADAEVRAALAFLLVERSSFYVSNRVSRVNPGRLANTLATLVERAYLEAP